jgi:hypothetical protein
VLFVLDLIACRPAFPSGFEVKGILRSGETITALFPGERVALGVVVAGGQRVELNILPPAHWSSLSTAGEVEWLSDKKIYLVRGASFTAEALRITPAAFTLQDTAGKDLEISWDDIRVLRFHYRR